MKSYINQYTLKKLKKEITATPISSSKNIQTLAKKLYSDDLEIFESMFLVCLDRANTPTAFIKISQGGVSETSCDVKLLAKYAIDTLSSSIILVHNHPSGNLKPSQSDINLTKKVKNALDLFDIKVLDHLILTVNGYYSFADEGIL